MPTVEQLREAGFGGGDGAPTYTPRVRVGVIFAEERDDYTTPEAGNADHDVIVIELVGLYTARLQRAAAEALAEALRAVVGTSPAVMMACPSAHADLPDHSAPFVMPEPRPVLPPCEHQWQKPFDGGRCDDCDRLWDGPYDDGPMYECGTCGTQGFGEDGRRCATCNLFAAKVEDAPHGVCDCGAALEAVRVQVCQPCGAVRLAEESLQAAPPSA